MSAPRGAAAPTIAGGPEVRGLLEPLMDGIRDALGRNVVGVYLRGSMALGDFDPVTSDIDYLVVTDRPVSETEFGALRELHDRLARLATRYAHHLEGSYIDRKALRRFGPGERRHPTVGPDWEFGWREHGDNWILERWVVRDRGVALVGPDPRSLIDPISPDELRDAVRAELRARIEGWAGGAQSTDWLLRRNYQAFEIETVCRALYTLALGGLPTKPQAAAWALAGLPAPWRDLVDRSRASRADETEDPSGIPDVMAFARWAALDGEAAVSAPGRARRR